jgi:hypothetical protein
VGEEVRPPVRVDIEGDAVVDARPADARPTEVKVETVSRPRRVSR